jgi:hypothetical protein
VSAPSTSHASKEQLRIEAQSCRIKNTQISPDPPWVTQRRAVLAEIEITELYFPANLFTAVCIHRDGLHVSVLKTIYFEIKGQPYCRRSRF